MNVLINPVCLSASQHHCNLNGIGLDKGETYTNTTSCLKCHCGADHSVYCCAYDIHIYLYRENFYYRICSSYMFYFIIRLLYIQYLYFVILPISACCPITYCLMGVSLKQRTVCNKLFTNLMDLRAKPLQLYPGSDVIKIHTDVMRIPFSFNILKFNATF